MLKRDANARRSAVGAVCDTLLARRTWPVAGLLATGLVATGLLALVLVCMADGRLPQRQSIWSIAVYEGDTPFGLAAITAEDRPALTAASVCDVDARFVADPFVVHDQGRWYLFCEVLNQQTGQGDIGLATSSDGLQWQYEAIVLDEPFHLSYPAVYRWQDNWYLVPESEAAGEVRLYRAVHFPWQWEQVGTLVRGDRLADPTLFWHQERWWMFVGQSHTHDRLRLFFADTLAGPWQEHPDSPVVENDADFARPGGRILHWQGQLFRLAQDCRPRYGNRLRAIPIIELNPDRYREDRGRARIVLQPQMQSWNNIGMHHCDAHPLPDGRWRGYVDGHTKRWDW